MGIRRRRQHETATETQDEELVGWLEKGHVIVVSSKRGREWVGGALNFDDYLSGAIEDARAEARDEVDRLLADA